MIVTHDVEVEIDIELADFPTKGLVEELRCRKIICIDSEDITDLIRHLRSKGCPYTIVEQLEQWAREPVVNKLRLDKWLEMARL